MEQQVGWFPGHMAKAARRIREDLRSIDVVVEVVDARVARSGRNPLLNELTGRRTHVIALTRQDLADPRITKAWLEYFTQQGLQAIALDGRAARNAMRIAAVVARSQPRFGRLTRAMIVGIPNSGKSSIVNALLRRGAAKTEARAGVTRQAQWFRLGPSVELMDTPGVLPPKFTARKRSGSSRFAAPFPASVTTRKKLRSDSTSGSPSENRGRRCLASRRSLNSAVLSAEEGSPTFTMRRGRISARSTTALSAAFLWRVRMTPKQRKAKTKYERERRRLHRLHRLEYAARSQGFTFLGGIDEVGRGPLAGPVVAACVVATEPLLIRGLNDSKRVRPELRVELAEIIKTRVTAWAVGSACVAEIDRLNIYWASILAMERAIAALATAPQYLITDAVRIRSFAGPQEPLVHRRRALRPRGSRLYRRQSSSRRAHGDARRGRFPLWLRAA